MAIVETRTSSRPNTSVELFNRTSDPDNLAFQAKFEETFGSTEVLIETTNDVSHHRKTATGGDKIIVEGSFDSTGLIFTRKRTYRDINIYSQAMDLATIAMQVKTTEYDQANGITATGPVFELTGIDASFKYTTTYNYNPDTVRTSYTLFDSFVNVIEASDNLHGFTDTGTKIIAEHVYANSADFVENRWKDQPFIAALHTAGITRNVNVAMI
jgi:hypothetical protein